MGAPGTFLQHHVCANNKSVGPETRVCGAQGLQEHVRMNSVLEKSEFVPFGGLDTPPKHLIVTKERVCELLQGPAWFLSCKWCAVRAAQARSRTSQLVWLPSTTRGKPAHRRHDCQLACPCSARASNSFAATCAAAASSSAASAPNIAGQAFVHGPGESSVGSETQRCPRPSSSSLSLDCGSRSVAPRSSVAAWPLGFTNKRSLIDCLT